jgi:hypothetical protein
LKYRNEITSLINDLRKAGVKNPQECKLGDFINFHEQDTEIQENSERHIGNCSVTVVDYYY